MRLGAHVSIAGGIQNAPGRAAALGCETFQLFSRSPRGGRPPRLTKQLRTAFASALARHRQQGFLVHTPYFINFASTTPRIRSSSISVVREELERAAALGAEAVVTHLGSTKDAGAEVGLHKTWRSIQRVLSGFRGQVPLLLEISAGAGDSIGGSFAELAALIRSVESRPAYRGRVGVCLDTCHAFAAGYDLRTKPKVDAVVRRFDRTVGLRRLRALHANDSLFDLNEHRDRHAPIGRGKIGLEGFRAIVNHPKLQRLPMVLETKPEGMRRDLATLKTLREP